MKAPKAPKGRKLRIRAENYVKQREYRERLQRRLLLLELMTLIRSVQRVLGKSSIPSEYLEKLWKLTKNE